MVNLNRYNQITSVACGEQLVAFSSRTGYLYLCELKKDLPQVATGKIFKKYITRMNWSTFDKRRLAICGSESDFQVVDCSVFRDDEISEYKTISGHTNKVLWVRWSKTIDHRLVSTSLDCTVKVC